MDAPNTLTFTSISSAKLLPQVTSRCSTVPRMTWSPTSSPSHSVVLSTRNFVLFSGSSSPVFTSRGCVNISRHPRTCLVLPTVTVIFILTRYILFIALHTMVTCLALFQIIYTRHYILRSCTSSPQCLSIHWGVRPLSLFYLFPYLLAVVPHYSTLGTTTEYISVHPFTEVTSLFYSSSLPVPAFLHQLLLVFFRLQVTLDVNPYINSFEGWVLWKQRETSN